MWGTMNQIRAVLLDKQCWMEHMMLDPETGLDPPGFKLRAAQGLDAADYFLPGYWVLARIISNLAAIGYDSNSMQIAAYDWRLSIGNLEARDLFFTKLKTNIELAYLTKMNSSDPSSDQNRIVIVSHSMGSVLTHYFLQWVESDLGGKGGKGWVDKYLKTWVNIAGPLLGSPKTLPSVLTGELRDTVTLSTYASYVVEQFFSRMERRELFRNWGGMRILHPKGGDHIWGSSTKDAPDDLEGTGKFGSLLEIIKRPPESKPMNVLFQAPAMPVVFSSEALKDAGEEEEESLYGQLNVTASTMVDFFDDHVENYTKKWVKDFADHVAESDSEVRKCSSNPRAWLNPLLSDYGGDKDTERFLIHTGITDTPSITNGILLSDGDVSVPLISLGYMCADGWRRKRYNPSGIKVITREHEDKPSGNQGDLRGGPYSANHVDIMGHHHVLEDILRVVSGNDENLEDQYYSRIRDISARVKLPGDK
ncbi:hypothetical protein HDU97_002309 [Phlyctochytrium planicorne]|nr:hypothetical protein HDU97_002309 [Phlyctochytrium planicorne]